MRELELWNKNVRGAGTKYENNREIKRWLFWGVKVKAQVVVAKGQTKSGLALRLRVRDKDSKSQESERLKLICLQVQDRQQ